MTASTAMNPNLKFMICAAGIFGCYFYFAILQEKITRSRYGNELNEDGSRGEIYTFALALVFVQCLTNWCFAKAMLLTNPPKTIDTTNKFHYASSALTYLLAMISSNMALRWVPYPTQVVGKSAKPIPVMILGVLIGNKRYTVQKYIFILLIVIGVCLFMYKDGKSKAGDSSSFGLGEILLILSLSMDGLTGAIQERMRASGKPSGQQMMCSMNGWSTILLIPAIFMTGELTQFLAFTSKYPNILVNILLLALTGAIGQLFIFLMVSGYGPLPCSVVTTTRKFFTVLCSVIFFGNVISSRQWLGAVLVFTGLFADMVMGKSSPPPPPPKKPSPIKDEANEKLIS